MHVTRILKLYSLHQRLSVFYKRKGRLWGRDGVKRYLFNIYQRSSGKKCLLHPLKVNTLVRQIEKLVMKFFLHLFKLSVSFDIINAKYIKDTFTLTDELTKFRQINQFNLMTYPLALKQRWLWPEKLLISEYKLPSFYTSKFKFHMRLGNKISANHDTICNWMKPGNLFLTNDILK